MIDAKDFLNVTRDIIEQQIRDRSTDAVCEIESINEDGTLNVFVLPDKQTILKNIINESRYNFRRGDNALLYKIHNRLSDSFVVAKFRPKQEDAGISEKSVQSLIDNALQNYQGGSGGDSGGIQGPPGPQGIQGDVGPTGPAGTVPHFYRHEIENMSTGTIDGIRFYLDMTTQNPTEQQILDAIPNGLVGQFLEIGTGWLPCSIYYNSKTNKISFCSPSYQNIDDEPSLFNFGVKKTTQLF
jgi:hypothetical protein